jgi:hypothetical protein
LIKTKHIPSYFLIKKKKYWFFKLFNEMSSVLVMFSI